MRAERTLIIDNQAQPNGREPIIHAQTRERQGTKNHNQSKKLKNKKGGRYTPEYEKPAPTDTKMSQNLEIHFSNHINVG